MTSAQWILAGPLIALFAILAVANAIMFVRRYVMRALRAPSLVPFIGGIAGACGFHSAPSLELHHIAWIPLVADIGCVPWIFIAFWMTSREKRRARKDK